MPVISNMTRCLASETNCKARPSNYFAEVRLLYQVADAVWARDELDWHASHPSPTDDFRQGSYRK